MIITDEILTNIRLYGSRNYPVSYMVTLLSVRREDRQFLRNEFGDPNSILWEAWNQGKVEHEDGVDQFLEKALENPGEGANDVARALHFRHKNRGLDEMKKDLFGI